MTKINLIFLLQARWHRQQQQQFASRHRGRRNRGGRGGFFAPFYRSNPQPGEARRWLRQARADVEAARNDEGCGHCCAFDWACVKYYQVYYFVRFIFTRRSPVKQKLLTENANCLEVYPSLAGRLE